MRAELAQAHAALSRVVEAMDGHLYTLRVDADGGYRDRLPRPEPRGAGRRAAPRRRRGRRAVGVARAPRRPRALAVGASRACREGKPIELEYRVRRPRRPRAHRARRRAPAPRRRTARCSTTASRATSPSAGGCEDELQRARGAAELRARTDELTGTFNRRHFAEIVAEALAEDPTGCALLMLDADHFKQVNDAHGHVVGDAVLVELARRLQRRPAARATAWRAGAARSSPCCCAASTPTRSSIAAPSGCARGRARAGRRRGRQRCG